MEKHPPGFAMNYRIACWKCSDAVERVVDGDQELLAESGPLRLIPQIGFLDILGGGGTNEQLAH